MRVINFGYFYFILSDCYLYYVRYFLLRNKGDINIYKDRIIGVCRNNSE